MSYRPEGFRPVPSSGYSHLQKRDKLVRVSLNDFGQQDDRKNNVPLSKFVEEDGVPVYHTNILERRAPLPEPWGIARVQGVENRSSIILNLTESPIWTPETMAATLGMIPVVLAVTLLCIVLLFLLLCCYKPREPFKHEQQRNYARPTSSRRLPPDLHHPRALRHIEPVPHADGPSDARSGNGTSIRTLNPVIQAPPNSSLGNLSMEEIRIEDIQPEFISEKPVQRNWLKRLVDSRSGKPPTPESDVYMNIPSFKRQPPPHNRDYPVPAFTENLLQEASNKLAAQPGIPSSSERSPQNAHTTSLRISEQSNTVYNRRKQHRDRWLSNIFIDKAPGTENLIVIPKNDGIASGAALGGDRLFNQHGTPDDSEHSPLPPIPPIGIYTLSSSDGAIESSNGLPEPENIRPGPAPAKFRLTMTKGGVASEEGYNASVKGIEDRQRLPSPGRGSVLATDSEGVPDNGLTPEKSVAFMSMVQVVEGAIVSESSFEGTNRLSGDSLGSLPSAESGRGSENSLENSLKSTAITAGSPGSNSSGRLECLYRLECINHNEPPHVFFQPRQHTVVEVRDGSDSGDEAEVEDSRSSDSEYTL